MNTKNTEIFLRKSISEEQETVSLYLARKQEAEQYARECRQEGNEELAKKFDIIAYTLNDIMEEEQVHIGQFTEMLYLLGVTEEKEEEGKIEGKEDIQKLTFVSVANELRNLI